MNNYVQRVAPVTACQVISQVCLQWLQCFDFQLTALLAMRTLEYSFYCIRMTYYGLPPALNQCAYVRIYCFLVLRFPG